MEEKTKKMEELLNDENKLAEIVSENPEEFYNNLKAYGIDLTREEFDALMDGMRADSAESDVLSEADLENVAGGSKKGYNFWYKVGQAVDKALYRIFGHK